MKALRTLVAGSLFLAGSAFAGAMVEGTWASECFTDTTDPKAQISWNLTNAFDAKGNFVSHESSYSDRACGTMLSDTIIMGTYKETAVKGMVNLDRVVTNFMVAFSNTDLIKALNMIQFCDFTDWEAGVAKDVTGMICFVPRRDDSTGEIVMEPVPFPEGGIEEYNIANVVSNVLYMGILDENHDGSTPKTRPIKLDTTGYKKM